MDNREYYQNLLIIQYHDKPNAKETIGVMYDTVIPKNSLTGNNLLEDIRDAFNLDTAVGVQLDMLGHYIGLNRLYQGQSFDDIKAYGYTDQFGSDYSDVVGFSTPENFLTEEGTFLSATEVISITNKLNDDDFRFLLKLKAAQNNCDHSCYAIDQILYTFFDNKIYYIDNQDMTMTYFVHQDYIKLLPVIFQKKLLLKPMGVRINNIILAQPYYGFLSADHLIDLNFDDNSGFSSVDTFLTDEGTFLGLEDLIVI